MGTDVGGTFTDVWVRSSDGRTKVVKSPTTTDVVEGVVAGLRDAAAAFGLEASELCPRVRRFGHGTTVGLNALLTGGIAATGVLTTRGFGDTLEIGRMKRQFSGLDPSAVSDYLRRDLRGPIVPRRRVAEVRERVDRTGTVVVGLDEASARAAVDGLLREGVEAVAICTLWATENPVHERRLRELVAAAAPEVPVSVSHEVAASVGEYARMSTTAANAALRPVTRRYITRLERALTELGLRVPVLMTTVTGGVVPAEHLAERPVDALLSGPAAGVVACGQLGRRMGCRRVLSADVGGTSFDVGLIVDGEPLMATELSFGGVDLRLPCLDVRSIGAGGGSIASVRFGELTVGPQSAGADPGPACYRRGGTLPTATDADLVLGVLSSDDPFAGGLPLDRDAAERAITEHVARPLGLTVTEAAWGIRQVLDSRMADLLRRVTVERGHDPRTFTMLATGGSGPSHGWVLARELGIAELVVPATATVQSALGSATSDLTVTAERPVDVRLAPAGVPAAEDLDELATALESAGRRAVERPLAVAAGAAPAVAHTVAMRYRGQTHHLDVPLAPGDLDDPARFAACVERFERAYEALFGRGAGFRDAGFELHHVRAVATTALDGGAPPAPGEPLRRVGSRDVWFDDVRAPVVTDVYAVEQPAADQVVEGPCLITYPGQTAVVPPGAVARTDALGSLWIGGR